MHKTSQHVLLIACAVLASSVSTPSSAQSGLPGLKETGRAPATVVAGIASNMVEVPAGKFQMGGSEPDERPIHWVYVATFRLSKYEVTFEQFDAFARATERSLPWTLSGEERGTRPVVNVSWNDAQAFIAWLNQATGLRYRLPSEAEWEYAARSGSKKDFPWGARFDANKANGSGTSGADQWEYTAPVGSFPPNAFGLHDMIGNVWEWTQDCSHFGYKEAPADGSAWTTGDCAWRVSRGGSWGLLPATLRVSNRDWSEPTDRYNNLGFRLAQDQ